jgi:hypothetical protein
LVVRQAGHARSCEHSLKCSTGILAPKGMLGKWQVGRVANGKVKKPLDIGVKCLVFLRFLVGYIIYS